MEQVNPSQYDQAAERFTSHMETQPYNVLYERPAMRSLVGDVTGLDVLDVACGAGSLSAEMIESGASSVVGCDGSSEMLEIARGRVPPGTELHHQDCCGPFEWADAASFDVITMSLALHYLNDRVTFLAEMHRVLRPGGAFVISTHHPTDDWRRLDGSYFTIGLNTDDWKAIGQDVTAWRLPLTAITGEFYRAGFLIEQLVEPLPTPEMQAASPHAYAKLLDCPAFILFRLVKPEVGQAADCRLRRSRS